MLHGGWDPCVHQASNESWARTATQKTSLCGRGRNCQERSQENRHGPVGNSSYLWKSSVSYIPCLPAVHLMQRSPWHVAKRVRPSMKDSWDISPWICHGVFHTPGIEDSLTLSQALGLPLPSWSSTLLCYYAGVWICYPKTDGCSWMFESLAFGSRNRFFQSVPRRCLFSPLCLFLSLSLFCVWNPFWCVRPPAQTPRTWYLVLHVVAVFFLSFCERVTVRALFKCHYQAAM